MNVVAANRGPPHPFHEAVRGRGAAGTDVAAGIGFSTLPAPRTKSIVGEEFGATDGTLLAVRGGAHYFAWKTEKCDPTPLLPSTISATGGYGASGNYLTRRTRLSHGAPPLRDELVYRMISDLDLLQAVKEATSEEFVVYGELGREKTSRVALLALDRARQVLVVLVVSATTAKDGTVELGVDVREELDARVPDNGTFCVGCGTRLRPWGRYCQHCGLDVLGNGGTGDMDTADMREAVNEAITGDYELLGEMRRKESGGLVYFARERSTGRIAALRLSKGRSDGEYELGETKVMKRSRMADAGMSLSVTQLLRPLEGTQPPASKSAAPRNAPPSRPTPSAQPNIPPRATNHSPPAQPQWPRAQPTSAPMPQQQVSHGPQVDWGESTSKWARKNRGPLAGLGVAALLALLSWVALKG